MGQSTSFMIHTPKLKFYFFKNQILHVARGEWVAIAASELAIAISTTLELFPLEKVLIYLITHIINK